MNWEAIGAVGEVLGTMSSDAASPDLLSNDVAILLQAFLTWLRGLTELDTNLVELR